jgi:predicted dehydrogenase
VVIPRASFSGIVSIPSTLSPKTASLTSNIKVFENFIHVMGNFSELKSILRNDYPTAKLISAAGEVTDPSHPRSTPSHISILGTLNSGATASITYRTTSPSVEPIGLRWLITGTEGEIEITTPEAQWQSAPLDQITLKARIGKGETDIVDFMGEEDGVIEGLRSTARNTARLYEGFAKSEREKYPDFRQALEIQRLLDLIREEAGDEWKVKG